MTGKTTAPKLNNILTTSSCKTFKDCPYKFFLSYVLGLRPEQEKEYFRFGSNWHMAMELLGNDVDPFDAVNAVRSNYEVRPDYIDSEKWLAEYWTIACCVLAYAAHYEGDGVIINTTEEEFCVPVVNPATGRASTKWQMAGKIDRTITIGSRNYLGEHKTTRDDIGPGCDYWAGLRLDSQPSNYVAALRAKGRPVDGVWYDVLRKPVIKPKRLSTKDFVAFLTVRKYCGQDFDVDIRRTEDKKISGVAVNGESVPVIGLKSGITMRETPEMFGARVMQDVTSDPGRYFARYELARTEADLEAAAYELWFVMQQINSMFASGQWYRNERECLRMGRCEYCNICFNSLDPTKDQLDGYVVVENVHQELACTATREGEST